MNFCLLLLVTFSFCSSKHFVGGFMSRQDFCSHGHNCKDNEECVNTRKTFRCRCLRGYVKDGASCRDENECAYQNGHCTQRCLNSPGSYRCLCHPGFYLAKDSFNCLDINECADSNGGCHHGCMNTIGSRRCTCLAGHYLSPDGVSCIKITTYSHQKCENCGHHCAVTTNSSAECVCHPGYRLKANGKQCKADSCAVNNGACQHKCTEKRRRVVCSCSPGYNLITTEGGGECRATCLLDNGRCEYSCKDTAEGPMCACPVGYQLAKNKRNCIDIDECSSNKGGCSHACANTNGSYECLCPSGYQVDAGTKICIDIDECQHNDTCDHLCVNVQGSYTCQCPIGYALYGISHCADFDECSVYNGGCEHECINSEGSYSCACDHGFYLHSNLCDCVNTEVKRENRCDDNLLLASPLLTIVSCQLDRGLTTCQVTCNNYNTVEQPALSYRCGEETRMTWQLIGSNSTSLHCSDKMKPADVTSTLQYLLQINSSCADVNINRQLLVHPVREAVKEYRCRNATCNIEGIRLSCERSAGAASGVIAVVFNFTVSPKGACPADICNVRSRSMKKHRKRFIKALRRKLKKLQKQIDGKDVSLLKRSLALRCPNGYILRRNHCVACGAGTYYKDGKCKMCARGFYQDEQGALSCKACPQNTSAVVGTRSRWECQGLCSPGSMSVNGTLPCVQCSRGSYQPFAGRSHCIECPAGVTTQRVGAISFTECQLEHCEAGSYYDINSLMCKLCGTDSYQPLAGQDHCIRCPGSTRTDRPGSMRPTHCKDSKCGGLFNGTRYGWITSPNWPGMYPANSDCVWQILPEKGRRVLILIPEISLADDIDFLCQDVLIIRKSESPYSTQTYETCSSVQIPLAFIARSQSLWIKFKSDGSNSGQGFNLPFVTFDAKYTTLMQEIVKDGRLYTASNHQKMFKDRTLMERLVEVIADPSIYQQYARESASLLPASFVNIIAEKMRQFYYLIYL